MVVDVHVLICNHGAASIPLLAANDVNRSNIEGITKKDRPLTEKHFTDFEKCFGTDVNGNSIRKDEGETGRFRCFTLEEIKKRNYKLDITWLKDESIEEADNLPEPNELATEAISELETVVDDLREILTLLESNGNGE